jgi:hypothetical protein
MASRKSSRGADRFQFIPEHRELALKVGEYPPELLGVTCRIRLKLGRDPALIRSLSNVERKRSIWIPRPSSDSLPRNLSIPRSISPFGPGVGFGGPISMGWAVRREPPRSCRAVAILSGVIGFEMKASIPARRQASLFMSVEWAVVAIMMVRRVDGSTAL